MRSCRIGKIGTLIARLARDKAGNALMLTAAAMIPLTGMVGSALDLSRLYLVKVRLQHACDAGALAGRRSMAAGAWGDDDLQVANQFFNDNFLNGAYGTGTDSYTFTQPTGGTSVHGVASTTVPMTLMRVFAAPTQTISVTCDSDMQMPNTDVMFVLDNTGSMACLPSEGSCGGNVRSGSKITVLKNAVKCFYEALAQLDTNGTCTVTNTGKGVPTGTQLRFGFVPYTTNVNVGSLGLPSSYFAANWPYQSREKYTGWSDWSTYATGSNSSNPCASNKVPANTSTAQYQASGSYSSCVVTKRTYGDMWHYGKVNLAFSGFSPSGTTVTIPIGTTAGAFGNRTVAWDGCSEEMAATTDINAMASGQLGPALPDALFLRASSTSGLSSGSMQTTDAYTTDNYYNSVRSNFYYCPTAAQKLQTWTTANFDNYVDSLTSAGNTYHDVGMLWGGRLLSPDGIYKADNSTTANGGQIQRHMIFMTDGDARAAPCDYQQFGIAWWDRRTNSSVGNASACASDNSTLDNDLNARLALLCTAVKAEPNTILWVISYGGTGIATATKTRLQTCATDTAHYFDATDSASLQTAFQTIASKIAQLRITG